MLLCGCLCISFIHLKAKEIAFLLKGVSEVKQINKMKVLVVTFVDDWVKQSLFILVNDQVNQSNNQLIAANKVKTKSK